MKRHLLRLSLGLVWFALTSPLHAGNEPGQALPEKPDGHGWIKLFDEKTLSGWTAPTP
ncbi:MAG: hypothetical protein JWQ04_186, partial [Pedosphaera sp.]|nr:hypothetical protein [Pedosphaera sp.]